MAEATSVEARLDEILEAWAYGGGEIDDLQAIAALRQLVDDHDDDDPQVAQVVLAAARQCAELLTEHDRDEEASELVAELLARFGADPEVLLRRRVASQAYDLAVEQRRRDELGPAEATYLALLDACADDADDEVRQRVASAMLNLGYLRMELHDRLDEALVVYDDLLRRFDLATGPEMRETLARAAASRNACLNKISRRDGGAPGTGHEDYPLAQREVDLAELDEVDDLLGWDEYGMALHVVQPVVVRLVGATNPERRRLAVRALYRRGLAQSGLGRDADAVTTCTEAVNLYGFDLSTDMELEVSRCLAKQAPALDRLGRHGEEAAVYRAILDRWSASTLPELHERVAWACWCLAVTLAVEDPTQGVAAYQDTIDQFRDDPAVTVRRRAATAAYNLVLLLKTARSPAEVVATGRGQAGWLLADEDPDIRRWGHKVQLAVARVLDPVSQREEKRAAYRELAALPEGELTADQRKAVLSEFGALGPRPLKDVITFFRRGVFRRP